MLTKCQSATGHALWTFHLIGDALAAEALRVAKPAAVAAAAMPNSLRRVI